MTIDFSILPPTDQLSPSLGILGGMGPLASASFLQELLRHIPVKKDRDYPRIVLDSNPHIPSRSRAYLYGEASPLPGMIAACRELEAYKPEYIAIPCNNAQAWITELQQEIKTPIVNIFETAVDSLRNNLRHPCPVVVLGGAVTHGKQSYKPYLKRAGFTYQKISEALQKQVEDFIETAKLAYSPAISMPGHNSAELLAGKFENLIKTVTTVHSQAAVILGCTEFGLVPSSLRDIRIIDSMTEYAVAVAQLLTRKKEAA
jgi:aspartate racemase